MLRKCIHATTDLCTPHTGGMCIYRTTKKGILPAGYVHALYQKHVQEPGKSTAQVMSGGEAWGQVTTLGGSKVWRRRHYRVRRAQVPGTFYFSVLDNGVTSNEFWRWALYFVILCPFILPCWGKLGVAIIYPWVPEA
jgi:hypothetical protein